MKSTAIQQSNTVSPTPHTSTTESTVSYQQPYNNKLTQHITQLIQQYYPVHNIDTIILSDINGVVISYIQLNSSSRLQLTSQLKQLLHYHSSIQQQINKLECGDYSTVQLNYTNNMTLIQYNLYTLVCTYCITSTQCNKQLCNDITAMINDITQPLRMQIQLQQSQENKEYEQNNQIPL